MVSRIRSARPLHSRHSRHARAERHRREQAPGRPLEAQGGDQQQPQLPSGPAMVPRSWAAGTAALPYLTAASASSCCISGMRRQSPAGPAGTGTCGVIERGRERALTRTHTACCPYVARTQHAACGTCISLRFPSTQPPQPPPVCSTGRRPGGSNRIMTAPGQWLASRNVTRTPSTVIGELRGTSLHPINKFRRVAWAPLAGARCMTWWLCGRQNRADAWAAVLPPRCCAPGNLVLTGCRPA